MPFKDSFFHNILNVTVPWEIIALMYSKHRLRIDLKIDYRSDTIDCPLCNSHLDVIDKVPITWQYLDVFQYSTHITTYLPVVDSHKLNMCMLNQATLNNVVLLNVISGMKKAD
jgi:hypothetical protein